MQIRYHCPTGNCVAVIEFQPLEAAGEEIECPRCRVRHPLSVSETVRRERMVDICAVCRGRELFIRKDFPQKVGLAIVITAAVVSIVNLRHNFLIAYGALAAAVVLDLILYLIIGKVTVCYACRAEYRGGKLNPAHEGFDLATAEKY